MPMLKETLSEVRSLIQSVFCDRLWSLSSVSGTILGAWISQRARQTKNLRPHGTYILPGSRK